MKRTYSFVNIWGKFRKRDQAVFDLECFHKMFFWGFPWNIQNMFLKKHLLLKLANACSPLHYFYNFEFKRNHLKIAFLAYALKEIQCNTKYICWCRFAFWVTWLLVMRLNKDNPTTAWLSKWFDWIYGEENYISVELKYILL